MLCAGGERVTKKSHWLAARLGAGLVLLMASLMAVPGVVVLWLSS